MKKSIIHSAIIAFSFCGNSWTMEQDRVLAAEHAAKHPIVRKIACKIAQEHNSKTLLLSSADIKDCIFKQLINPHESIEDNIKNALNVSATCTHLNDLAYFGALVRTYPQEQRDGAMKKLQKSIYLGFNEKRRALILLIHTQAKHNVLDDTSLLLRAVSYRDAQVVELLFEYKANANEEYGNTTRKPMFWRTDNLAIIQLFIDNGANLNQPGDGKPNVLWYLRGNTLISAEKKLELMSFYIQKGVDPKEIDSVTGQSLLHFEACLPIAYKNNTQVVTLLLEAMHEIINDLDNRGNTVLDYAYTTRDVTLTTLFREYDAKTAKELNSNKK